MVLERYADLSGKTGKRIKAKKDLLPKQTKNWKKKHVKVC